MAKHESTAVNALIQRTAAQGPPVSDADDLMFATPPSAKRSATPPRTMPPLPRARTPQGTQPNPSLASADAADAADAATLITTRPTVPSMPSIPPAPRHLARASLPPPVRTSMRAASAMPPIEPAIAPVIASVIAPAFDVDVDVEVEPVAAVPPLAARADAPLFDVDAPWLDDARAVESEAAAFVTERTQIGRIPRSRSLWVTLVPWMAVMVLLGVFIGGVFVFKNKRASSTAPATEPVTEPAVIMQPVAAAVATDEPVPAAAASTDAEPSVAEPSVAEPSVAEPSVAEPSVAEPPVVERSVSVAPTRAQPLPPTALVDVRIDSKPSGATVHVIRGGQPFFLGTTPLRTGLDPRHSHEIELTHARRAPTRHVIDPSAVTRTMVVLDRPSSAVRTPAVAAPAKPAGTSAEGPVEKPVDKSVDKAVDKAVDKPAIAKTVVPATPAVGAEGLLLLASKPPCEIYIDGRATGMMTPQRAIKLPVGPHRITLVNAAQGVKKTFKVQIDAGEPTKVIQNLMP